MRGDGGEIYFETVKLIHEVMETAKRQGQRMVMHACRLSDYPELIHWQLTKRVQTIQTSTRGVGPNPKEVSEHWRGVFSSNNADKPEWHMEFDGLLNRRAFKPYTTAEMQKAIERLKKGKAAGPSGLTHDVLRYLDASKIEELRGLYSEQLETGQVDAVRAKMVLLPKNGEKIDGTAMRPIMLMETLRKLSEALALGRLEALQEADLIPKFCIEQAAYKKNSGCHHHLLTTQIALQHAKKQKKPLILTSLDMAKAFDKVPKRYAAWLCCRQLLRERDGSTGSAAIDPYLARLIYNLTTAPFLAEYAGEQVPVLTGVPQGGLLSPFLFSCVMEVVSARLHECSGYKLDPNTTLTHLIYADDILLFDNDTESVRAKFDIVRDWASSWGGSLNNLKTQVVVSSPNRLAPGPSEVVLDGVAVEFSPKLKYLGMFVTADGVELVHDTALMRTYPNCLKYLTHCENFTAGQLCMIGRAAMWSKISYGIQVTLPQEVIRRSPTSQRGDRDPKGREFWSVCMRDFQQMIRGFIKARDRDHGAEIQREIGTLFNPLWWTISDSIKFYHAVNSDELKDTLVGRVVRTHLVAESVQVKRLNSLLTPTGVDYAQIVAARTVPEFNGLLDKAMTEFDGWMTRTLLAEAVAKGRLTVASAPLWRDIPMDLSPYLRCAFGRAGFQVRSANAESDAFEVLPCFFCKQASCDHGLHMFTDCMVVNSLITRMELRSAELSAMTRSEIAACLMLRTEVREHLNDALRIIRPIMALRSTMKSILYLQQANRQSQSNRSLFNPKCTPKGLSKELIGAIFGEAEVIRQDLRAIDGVAFDLRAAEAEYGVPEPVEALPAELHIHGLPNPSNCPFQLWCFFNALVQCLFHLPATAVGPIELGIDGGPLLLKELFDCMRAHPGGAYPRHPGLQLRRAVADTLPAQMQHDPLELLMRLMELLEGSLILAQCKFSTATLIECTRCGWVERRAEIATVHLSLAFPALCLADERLSLEDLVAAHFSSARKSNCPFCLPAGHPRTAMVPTVISHAPGLLIVQLNRFTAYPLIPDSESGSCPEIEDVTEWDRALPPQKRQNRVSMPLSGLQLGGKAYRLSGLVNHCGSLIQGHYTATVLVGGRYYLLDDARRPTAVDRRDVVTGDAYLAFYVANPEPQLPASPRPATPVPDSDREAVAPPAKKPRKTEAEQRPITPEPEDKSALLIVFTDGGCSGNGSATATASSAAIFLDHEEHNLASLVPAELPQTNNVGELHAAILALRIADIIDPNKELKVTIFTDCKILVNTMMTGLIERYVATRFKGLRKSNSELTGLFQQLYALTRNRLVAFLHVAAHTGRGDWASLHNDRVDKLASSVLPVWEKPVVLVQVPEDYFDALPATQPVTSGTRRSSLAPCLLPNISLEPEDHVTPRYAYFKHIVQQHALAELRGIAAAARGDAAPDALPALADQLEAANVEADLPLDNAEEEAEEPQAGYRPFQWTKPRLAVLKVVMDGRLERRESLKKDKVLLPIVAEALLTANLGPATPGVHILAKDIAAGKRRGACVKLLNKASEHEGRYSEAELQAIVNILNRERLLETDQHMALLHINRRLTICTDELQRQFPRREVINIGQKLAKLLDSGNLVAKPIPEGVGVLLQLEGLNSDGSINAQLTSETRRRRWTDLTFLAALVDAYRLATATRPEPFGKQRFAWLEQIRNTLQAQDIQIIKPELDAALRTQAFRLAAGLPEPPARPAAQ